MLQWRHCGNSAASLAGDDWRQTRNKGENDNLMKIWCCPGFPPALRVWGSPHWPGWWNGLRQLRLQWEDLGVFPPLLWCDNIVVTTEGRQRKWLRPQASPSSSGFRPKQRFKPATLFQLSLEISGLVDFCLPHAKLVPVTAAGLDLTWAQHSAEQETSAMGSTEASAPPHDHSVFRHDCQKFIGHCRYFLLASNSFKCEEGGEQWWISFCPHTKNMGSRIQSPAPLRGAGSEWWIHRSLPWRGSPCPQMQNTWPLFDSFQGCFHIVRLQVSNTIFILCYTSPVCPGQNFQPFFACATVAGEHNNKERP